MAPPPSRRLRLALAAAVVVAVAVLAQALTGPDAAAPSDPDAPPVGLTWLDDRPAAADRELPLVERDGRSSLGALDGEVTVVNFWASWCGPCEREQPELNAAYERLGDRAAFLGVAVLDPPEAAREHAERLAIPYPSLLDRDGAYSDAFSDLSPQALPVTLFVDHRGRVAARYLGPITADVVEDTVAALEAEAGRTG